MRECSDREPLDFDTVGESLKDLIDAQATLGGEVLKLVGVGARALLDGLGGVRMPRGCSSCDIPEPCWMPKSLGEARCELAPGETGTIRLTIVNEDFRAHPVAVEAIGDGAAAVQFTPANLNLGPKQRATVIARYTAPAQAQAGDQDDLVLWVHGCRDHYLRWRIALGCKKGRTCCYEVEVKDAPDYVVHWYDHFYCPRPCPGVGGRRDFVAQPG